MGFWKADKEILSVASVFPNLLEFGEKLIKLNKSLNILKNNSTFNPKFVVLGGLVSLEQ